MNNKIKKQLGFVLSELVVAISLVVILLGTTVQLYDTNRSRAELLHEKMSEVASGLLRMKTDASCFPTKLAGMVNPVDGSDTFCGAQSSDSWKGPYTAVGTRFGTDSGNAKDIMLEQISPSLSVYLDEVVISANSNASGPSNEKKAWILKTRGLTSEIQTQFLDFCSKPVAGATGQPKSRCFAEASGQVGFLVDANEGWEQYYNALLVPVVAPDTCKGASCVKAVGPAVPVIPFTPCTIGVDCPVTPPSLCPDGSAPVAGVCPTTPLTKYCPNGTVMPASGVCPAVPSYCPDGITVVPASGVCPTIKPICVVGVDPKCPTPIPGVTPTGGASSSSSSGGSGLQPGYRGSDGQTYATPNAEPGKTEPCSNCKGDGTTYEKDAADAAGKSMGDAASSGGSIGGALSSFASAVGGAFSAIAGAFASIFSAIASLFSGSDDGDDGGDGVNHGDGGDGSSTTSSTTSTSSSSD